MYAIVKVWYDEYGRAQEEFVRCSDTLDVAPEAYYNMSMEWRSRMTKEEVSYHYAYDLDVDGEIMKPEVHISHDLFEELKETFTAGVVHGATLSKGVCSKMLRKLEECEENN